MGASARPRRRSRAVAGTSAIPRSTRTARPVGTPLRPRPVGDLTVQLLPGYLAEGSLGRFAVADELELVPAIYAGGHRPAPGGRDRWSVDEFGTVDARGTLLAAPVAPGQCDCRVDVLDVAGALYPFNWADTAPTDGRIHAEGALYLEPELTADTEHADAVALCRRRYRVTALRRYRRTAGRPIAPGPLPAVPAPRDVSESAVYVADLCRLADEAPG